ncbi:MAG: diaminopimelate decarboxylase [Acidiferrobacterales bacterium]
MNFVDPDSTEQGLTEAFYYQDGELFAEGVSLRDIADAVDTPCYVYSRAMIEATWKAYDEAFGGRDHLVCYAVKANSNIAILNLLARLGSGFDIVSGGELERVLRAGGQAENIVFSGVGKGETEMRRALEAGIGCFNVESEAELYSLNEVAASMGVSAPVSFRVNPDVDPNTHPYISTGMKESKFGIAIHQAGTLYENANELSNIELKGVACHIGSQLTEVEPFVDALERVLSLVGDLSDAGIDLAWLDLGGGLGVRYYDERPPTPDNLVFALMNRLQEMGSRYQRMRVIIEPGRSIVANAGVLLTRTLYLKHSEARNFAVVDAAMNDMMRPALYDAWMDIVPVNKSLQRDPQVYDIVGPICESGDFLGRDRKLPVAGGDLLAIMSSGAYGASMSSNYNTRPRAAEVLVDGDHYHVVRRRETVDELLAAESLLPEQA